MKNEIAYPHVLNGRPTTVWVEDEGDRPGDFCISGATDDETDEEVELPEADKEALSQEIFDSRCGSGPEDDDLPDDDDCRGDDNPYPWWHPGH